VILSLVRSNDQGILGFTSDINRINVALSRARHGLYIFGDTTCIRQYCLKNRSNIWSRILDAAEKNKNIVKAIEFYCYSHTEKVSKVETLEDWNRFSLSCPKACGRRCVKDKHK
jgi:superfamily I DNA and/or RNA helicase